TRPSRPDSSSTRCCSPTTSCAGTTAFSPRPGSPTATSCAASATSSTGGRRPSHSSCGLARAPFARSTRCTRWPSWPSSARSRSPRPLARRPFGQLEAELGPGQLADPGLLLDAQPLVVGEIGPAGGAALGGGLLRLAGAGDVDLSRQLGDPGQQRDPGQKAPGPVTALGGTRVDLEE